MTMAVTILDAGLLASVPAVTRWNVASQNAT